jgi:pyruvate/2-oxoglutarate dehydrogenase complex dihydrolipoamide dehydrogenase (E3) component
VITALDAYYDPAKVGGKAVVIGGALVGCEIGLHLAEMGRQVTIVEMRDAIGDPINWRHTIPMVMKMDTTPNLSYKTGLKCAEVTSSGIKATDKQGKEHRFEADTVILAVGMQANSDVVEQLRNCVPDFYPVGDCVKPLRIMEAMQGGYFAALDIL